MEAARDQSARDGDRAAVAHGKRKPTHDRHRHLQAEALSGDARNQPLGYVHLDERARHRAYQDEGHGLDDDRREDQDEALSGIQPADVCETTRDDHSRGYPERCRQSARRHDPARGWGKGRHGHNPCSR
jgi:hypothetical protein